jgi:succinate dehydrogenase / fumarate reductase cytochrome b subunit
MPVLPTKKARPVWFNLSPLNLPLPGLVSILHRVSGLLLFAGLVWFLYLLDMSLSSEAGFAHFKAYIAHPLVKLVLLGYLWSYLHHFCAGIRYLFLDLHKAIDLPSTRKTSYAVFAVSIGLTLILGAKLW